MIVKSVKNEIKYKVTIKVLPLYSYDKILITTVSE